MKIILSLIAVYLCIGSLFAQDPFALEEVPVDGGVNADLPSFSKVLLAEFRKSDLSKDWVIVNHADWMKITSRKSYARSFAGRKAEGNFFIKIKIRKFTTKEDLLNEINLFNEQMLGSMLGAENKKEWSAKNKIFEKSWRPSYVSIYGVVYTKKGWGDIEAGGYDDEIFDELDKLLLQFSVATGSKEFPGEAVSVK